MPIRPPLLPCRQFTLFTRLRRWVFGYFVVYTFIIVAQIIRMDLWQRVVLIAAWELAQVAVTVAIAYAFRAGASAGASRGINPYLTREQTLQQEQARLTRPPHQPHTPYLMPHKARAPRPHATSAANGRMRAAGSWLARGWLCA